MPKRLFWTGLRAALVVGIIGAAAFLVKEANAEDLAIGDSIAVGTGQALHVRTAARENMSSCWILAHEAVSGDFEHVVISAGINDAPGSCIESIRAKYTNAKVVWILPAPINSARAHVAAVAAAHGDKMVSYRCAGACSKANFHPKSYPSVAAAVRSAWGVKFGRPEPESVAASTPISAPPPAPAPIYIPPVPTFIPVEDPHAIRTTAMPVKTIWRSIHDFFIPAKVSAILQEEAAKEDVPAELVLRVAHVESRGQCGADNGIAHGVMQVKTETARAMGISGNLHDCRTGARAGVRYLKRALTASHGNWAHAAALYNGGLAAPRRVTGYSRLVMAAEQHSH